MNLKILAILFLLQCYSTKKIIAQSGRVTIESKLPLTFKSDSVILTLIEVNRIGYKPLQYIKQKVVNGHVKWTFPVDAPMTIILEKLLKSSHVVEPGDSIYIDFTGERPEFSGQGFEKAKLQYGIAVLKEQIVKPTNPNNFTVKSLNDFLEWDQYLSQQTNAVIPLINSYENKISDFAFNYIKVRCIYNIEESRLDKFWTMFGIADTLHISSKDLNNVFDSCFYREPARWMRSMSDITPGWYAFIRAEIFRKYNFDWHASDLQSDMQRRFLYYDQGKKTYKGPALQRFLLDLMANEVIREVGITPESELLLARYYNEPGYPEYKNYVKEVEKKARLLRPGMTAPYFSLIDKNGNQFTSDQLKGKVAIIDFWFTGCTGCVSMAPVLAKLENEFKNDTNVVFCSISIDKDKELWLKSLKQKKYTTGEGISLYTAGLAGQHPVINAYSIAGYPSVYIFDAFGRIVDNPLPDPRDDKGEMLIDLIRKQLPLSKDGPYVMHEADSLAVYYLNGSQPIKKKIEENEKISLQVGTDQYNKTFEVALNLVIKPEPSEFAQPEKIFALSDIEGNFDAFRMLLQSNGIIDQDYNWTFGDGHLVFCGDMFDRGEQVTECLWLIYSLEQKAKKSGGYVHFILGNHEIMNLSGHTGYNNLKYTKNSQKLELPYSGLYGSNTVLGKWLRSKNIMEKIGDALFIHAGVTKEVADLPLTVSQINDMARTFYDRDSLAKKSADRNLQTIFDSKLSPFWYRLYYQDQEIKQYHGGATVYKTPLKDIDYVLSKYNVNRIVTGHTIVADGEKITIHYNGKVINTDTRHADHKSEALLIDKGILYRVNDKGQRQPLR